MIIAYDVTDKMAHFSWLRERDGARGHETNPRKATEILTATLDQLTREHEEALTTLGVVTGPGSFTGIRVGLACALGLQAVGKVSLVGYTKPALAAHWAGDGSSCLFLPAGRTQMLACPLADGKPAEEPRVVAPEEATQWSRRFLTQASPLIEGELLPQPFSELLLERLIQKDLEPTGLDPLYVRPADARAGTGLLEKLLKQKPNH